MCGVYVLNVASADDVVLLCRSSACCKRGIMPPVVCRQMRGWPGTLSEGSVLCIDALSATWQLPE